MTKYSAQLLDHFHNPRNGGTMENADLVGRASLNGRAPYVTIYVRLADEIMSAVMFQAFGCGATIAAASALTELAVGQRITSGRAITNENVVEALGGMPTEKLFCAALAIEALRDALASADNPEISPHK